MTNNEVIYKELIDKYYVENFDNKSAVDVLFFLLNKGLESSDDKVKEIYKQIPKIKDIEPRFNVFLFPNHGYQSNFKAFNISRSNPFDTASLAHEYGHAVFDIFLEKNVPDGYDIILENARFNALNSSNKEFNYGELNVKNGKFRDLLEYICNQQDSKKLNGIEPLSDIISSMWQYPGFNNSKGSPFILPYYHKRDYYLDKKGSVNYKTVFDEQFANFFSLKSTNQVEALNVLRNLFGDEWFDLMENNIDQIYSLIENDNKLGM